MEEALPEERPNAPETPRSSTPPSQVRPSLRAASNSSTGAFVFSSPTTGDSTDLLSTSPPYPDPNSLPTSPGFELNDPNTVGSGRRNASGGSTRSSIQGGLGAVDAHNLDASAPDISYSENCQQPRALEEKHRPRLPGQTGRESLGTISRNSTVRSTSTFLGRVGLSPTLDFGRRRGVSEEPGHAMAAEDGSDGGARRSSMGADYISPRRTSTSGASSSSSIDNSFEDGSKPIGDVGRPEMSEVELPALPSPPPDMEEYESDGGEEGETPLGAEDDDGSGCQESTRNTIGMLSGHAGHTDSPQHFLDEARKPANDFPFTRPDTTAADIAGASRRVRPRSSPQRDGEDHLADESLANGMQVMPPAMPRTVSSSSSIHRTIKANPLSRTTLSVASPPKSKRHSLSYSFTHSRSSSHTSTTLSTSPDKVKGLANGRSKAKGKARMSDASPSKESRSLWEDVAADEAAISDEEDVAGAGAARSPERNGGGDELDERIRQAEEKIRQSAMSRASRTRSSISVKPDSNDPSPTKSQLRHRDSYHRHSYTPVRADTLRRTATMGSAERSSRASTPVKQEPGDWVQGLEEQGEQRASGSSSNGNKRLPLPAEFRQSNSLFTPSPKVNAPGLPRRQSQLHDSPTSVRSSQSRFLESPSLARDLDRTRSTTPSSKRYSDTVSRSGSGSQYNRRQWSESISGLPSRSDPESRAGSSMAGLPRQQLDRRPDGNTDTIRDTARYRSNPSTLSSRAPLTPGDSVSAVGIPPYARAAGTTRASSMMPPHAQSQVGLNSARKDKDPLDVIRRMEQSREASNRQWTEDRAASVLGHTTVDAYNGQRSASRAGYANHSRGESSQYVRSATSMSSLRGTYDRDVPRTAPVDRRQSRLYDDADPVPELPSWQADSPLAQRRQGKHISLVPSVPPKTEPRPMRSSTSLGGRSSTSASMSHGASVVMGTSKTAHGKLLFEATQALEGRLPVDGDKAVELVRAVRGSAVAAEATNHLVRGISARLAVASQAEDLDDLANEIREASKKSDLAVRELTRVLLDLPRLLREVQTRNNTYSSRHEGSTITGEVSSRYTPSRLSVIQDDSYNSASAPRASPLSANRISVDGYARPQSVIGNYSRYAPSQVDHISPSRRSGQQAPHEEVLPSKGMRPSTSLGGFDARLRSPRKESMPAIDDSRLSVAASDVYAVNGETGGDGRSAVDMLRKTSMRDSTSRLRREDSRRGYSDARETQSMDVERPSHPAEETQSSLHARTRSYSPSKDSMISDHTATTADRTNGRAREDGPFSATRHTLRKKASVISTNTVRAVSGFAPNLMGKLPPATPATTDISYVTAGDISPTVARAAQREQAISRDGGSPAYTHSGGRTHGYRTSTDSRYSDASHSGSRQVRASLDEVEPSSPMSRYGLAHRPSDASMPGLQRTSSTVSSRSGTQDIEQGMRNLGLGRPDSRQEEQQPSAGLEKSKLARLTSWRLKR